MNKFYLLYFSGWILACIFALILLLRDRKAFSLSQRTYWRFLSAPWKVITFILAGSIVTLIAPYTDDPTWDYVDGFFISVMTYCTAPWTVGTIYRSAVRKFNGKQFYVAVCVWMFSASWGYDLYLLIRDGRYPSTWFPNIFASSFIYALAGLLWNLDGKPGRGIVFAFTEESWPHPVERFDSRLLWYALPILVIVGLLILQFLSPLHK